MGQNLEGPVPVLICAAASADSSASRERRSSTYHVLLKFNLVSIVMSSATFQIRQLRVSSNSERGQRGRKSSTTLQSKVTATSSAVNRSVQRKMMQILSYSKRRTMETWLLLGIGLHDYNLLLMRRPDSQEPSSLRYQKHLWML